MPIAVVCDCGKKLNVPDQFAGKQVKCPGCGGGLKVPVAVEVDAPVAPLSQRMRIDHRSD